MKDVKATTYEPELGQAAFGAPWGEYEVPAIGEEALRMVLDEMHRVYGNRYGKTPDFGGNDGFVLPNDALGPDLQYRAYCWADCVCDETRLCTCDVSKPNLAFDGVEFRWYKHARRGLSCNKQLSAKEWSKWLQKALNYLRDRETMNSDTTEATKVDPKFLRARAAEDCPALHDVPGACDCNACLLREAAGEIERLRATIATMKPIYDKYAPIEAIPRGR